MSTATEAEAEGYVLCVCGDYAVGMHQECRGLLTEAQYQKWSRS